MLISFISLLVARMNLYRFIAHETLRMSCVIMIEGYRSSRPFLLYVLWIVEKYERTSSEYT